MIDSILDESWRTWVQNSVFRWSEEMWIDLLNFVEGVDLSVQKLTWAQRTESWSSWDITWSVGVIVVTVSVEHVLDVVDQITCDGSSMVFVITSEFFNEMFVLDVEDLFFL